MEFRILGPLEVLERGDPLALGGSKQRALLAVLLLHANEAVSTDRLVDELWSGDPPGTAAHAIQVYVSSLRKTLGADRLLTRPTGYALDVARGELDLTRFERLVDEGRRALAAEDPERGAEALREALSLWRGSPLADFTYEAFAQGAIARLEELRLVALEERIEADLASRRHAELVGELQTLIEQHPLRERLRGQLMLALYRAGRQADALDVFQHTRRLLVDELGIEPSPMLQALERAILQQDPALEARAAAQRRPSEPPRSILLAAAAVDRLDPLIRLAEPLARALGRHELILALALAPHGPLAAATAALHERRAGLSARGVPARAAAFTSAHSGSDVVRLASEQNVDLVLLHGPTSVRDGTFADDVRDVLAEAPCDVALLFERDIGDGPVLVPFGGGAHEWAALELGAWYAKALGVGLTLLGSAGGAEEGERDASRLLAHAALAVQQLVGVATQPVLAAAGAEGVLEEAETACLLVIGLGEDWSERGLGATRAAAVERARPPTTLVRRGLRPGGLAPGDTLTRYTWSLAGAYAEPAGGSSAAHAGSTPSSRNASTARR